MATITSTKNFDVTLVTFIHSMLCNDWALTRFRITPSDNYDLTFTSKTGKDKIQHAFNLSHPDSLAYLYKVMADIRKPRS